MTTYSWNTKRKHLQLESDRKQSVCCLSNRTRKPQCSTSQIKKVKKLGNNYFVKCVSCVHPPMDTLPINCYIEIEQDSAQNISRTPVGPSSHCTPYFDLDYKLLIYACIYIKKI